MDKTVTTKRYLTTAQGQIHARVCGQGQPLVLLHTTPGSGLQFRHVMQPFADRGYQVWALDLLGNGRSDPLPAEWSFELSAQTIGQALDSAGCENVVLAGGHMAGQVAIELACQRPELVSHLIIDGIPMWDRAKRLAISKLFDLSAPEVAADGSHLLVVWQRAFGIQQAWNPNVDADSNRARLAVVDALQAGISKAAEAAFLNYEVAPRLAELAIPVLITTAEQDTLRDQFEAALGTCKAGVGMVFPGAHPTHCDDRSEEYVAVVDAFARGQLGAELAWIRPLPG